MKAKNFHWQMSGNHFRDYHLLVGEQSDEIVAVTDDIAERSRKIDTLRSVGDISGHQRLIDNDKKSLTPQAMLTGTS